ncbi:MAG: hypothetical protein CSB33_03030 [Desulfobacterales bacterium]|nr:MAG: hypothetical protein CSB33_03030 [Desulfobacterales bacterium]
MALKKHVKDIMIPLEKYAVVSPDAALKEAVACLRTSYCEMETGICAETGPRTVLVVDESGALRGLLDFRTILKVLVPEVAGKFSQKIAALGATIAFAEAGAANLDASREGLRARVVKNAGIKVRDAMLKSVDNIQTDTRLMDALKIIFRKRIVVLPVYDGDRLVGIVRDTDLFLAVADMLRE